MNAFTLTGKRAPGKGAKEMAVRSAILPIVDFGYSPERRRGCSARAEIREASLAERRVEQTGCSYLRKMHPRYRGPARFLRSGRRGSEGNVKREASGLTDKSTGDKKASFRPRVYLERRCANL